jgi:hypothetical protein
MEIYVSCPLDEFFARLPPHNALGYLRLRTVGKVFDSGDKLLLGFSEEYVLVFSVLTVDSY